MAKGKFTAQRSARSRGVASKTLHIKRPYPVAQQPMTLPNNIQDWVGIMLDPDMTIPDRIRDIIDREMDEFSIDSDEKLTTLDAFRSARRTPREVTVNFAGGIQQKCWSVTESNGDYRVIFLPRAGYFSLCVESDFGPLDIGVHGSAIGCFSSV